MNWQGDFVISLAIPPSSSPLGTKHQPGTSEELPGTLWWNSQQCLTSNVPWTHCFLHFWTPWYPPHLTQVFTLVKALGHAWTWGLIKRVPLDRGLYLRQVDYGRCGDSKEWPAKRGIIEGCGKDYYWLQAFITLSVVVNPRTPGPSPIESLLLGRDHGKTHRS